MYTINMIYYAIVRKKMNFSSKMAFQEESNFNNYRGQFWKKLFSFSFKCYSFAIYGVKDLI